VRANTRREYRRLLVIYALSYFDREVRVRDLDRPAVQRFVDWLTTRPGRDGRLCDRSIANVLTPLRLALDAAVAEGLLDANPAEQVVLPRRRAGRAWSTRERRFLTRAELVRLLDEIPPKWRPLFELLAATGVRISEAIGLRWSDLVLDGPAPHLQVRRAIVKGAAVAPKSRHGARLIPLTPELAATLRAHRPRNGVEDAFVFPGRDGGASDQGSLRRRVLIPAAARAGLTGVGFHTLRHTCASMLIESGLSPLRLQRWMGHHSPAFTLETYGHLIDGDLGPALDPAKSCAVPSHDQGHTTRRASRTATRATPARPGDAGAPRLQHQTLEARPQRASAAPSSRRLLCGRVASASVAGLSESAALSALDLRLTELAGIPA
jgi:integrase